MNTNQKATIHDVAKLASVSVSTVSRVINDSPEVSKKTRRRVEKVMQELNYIPNAIARSLVCKTSNTVGVIISDLTNPFFSYVIEGLEDYLNSLGFTIILSNTRYRKEKEKQYITQMMEKRVDGLIIIDAYVDNAPLINMIKDVVPIVALQSSKFEGVDCVNSKDDSGAYDAVDYLIKLGHKKIALLTYNYVNATVSNRTKGYKDAHKKHGIPVNEDYILAFDLAPNCGYYMANEILSRHPEVTAFFCFNDDIALSAYNAIHMSGKRIPHDISVIGFDNLEIGSLSIPKLTTVEQPMYEMGRVAAEILVRRIKEDKRSERQEIILPTKLIVKESTKSI